jgi:amino acid adenylation domain-containing protein
MHVLEAIARHMAAQPQAPALWARGAWHSYAQLAHAVGQVQAQLRTLPQVPPRVGILTGDDMPTYAALLAILGLGSAYVPVNAHHPPERNAAIVEDAALQVILCADPAAAQAALLPAHRALLQPLAIDPAAPGPAPYLLAQPDDTLAYILFTSGSTGRPKGVPISHGNLRTFLAAVADPAVYALGPQDRFLQMFDLTFDLSVYSWLLPLALGASTAILPADGISYLAIAELLEELALTVALMVPSVLAYLQPYFAELHLPHLRLSLFCGEALPHATTLAWSHCIPNARIENVYGPTEATIFCLRYVWVADTAATESVHGIVPIGQPLPGTQAFVADADGQPLPPGTPGELCLMGGQLCTGYWYNPQKTAAAFFHTRWTPMPQPAYRTGDEAYVNAKGDFIYTGRIDNQVKIDGYRVELGELEHHARTHTGLAQVACVAAPGPQGSTVLHLFLEGDWDDMAGLRAHLQSQLPPYMQPRQIHTLARLPLNVNGKIDRKALIQQLSA